MNLPLKVLPDRGYSYIPAVFQYSSGVAALPGYRLHRVRFRRVLSMPEGFAWIERYLTERGLPLTAFASCELRSPRPFSPDGFKAFNMVYADKLRSWKIFEGDDNPVGRSNVCPELNPPAETGFYAFTYVTRAASDQAGTRPSFVVAGGAETLLGLTRPEDRIVAFRDISPEGMKRKARQTLGKMSDRLDALGADWADTTAVHAYSIFDIYPLFLDEIARRGAAVNGLVWYPCRPPVEDIDYEMDCRGLDAESVVEP